MRLRRSPVELLRARTMPMWPLWVLLFLTPVLHTLWLAEFHGISQISWEETYIYYETTEPIPISEFYRPELIALAIALGVWAWYHFTRRDLNRRFLAVDGWQYRRGSTRPHAGRFGAFPRPRRRASALSNLAWGPLGDWLASSYTLWTSKVHRYSVERVELPVDLPALVIMPLGWFDRIAQGLEFAPFAVESADFNAKWRVVAADARVASAVLHPRMMEYLLSDTFTGDVGITVDDAAVMVWSPGRVKRADIGWRLAAAQKFESLVPTFAYEQFGTPRPDDWGPASMTLWAESDAAAAAAKALAEWVAAEERAKTQTVAERIASGHVKGLTPYDWQAYRRAELDRMTELAPGPLRAGRAGFVMVALAGVFVFPLALLVAFATGLWPLPVVVGLVAIAGAALWTWAVRRIVDVGKMHHRDAVILTIMGDRRM